MRFTVQKWPTERVFEREKRGLFDFQVFERRSPRTGKVGAYQVLHIADWVNVIALTPAREVILVEQYRHGLDDITFEIPGGGVDPEEDPATAVARELREETGFAGDPPILLGLVHPNPAFQGNRCSTYLIENAHLAHDVEPDDSEDLAVHLLPLADIPELLKNGRITHSLVIAAFHWLALAGR